MQGSCHSNNMSAICIYCIALLYTKFAEVMEVRQ